MDYVMKLYLDEEGNFDHLEIDINQEYEARAFMEYMAKKIADDEEEDEEE